MLQNVCGVLVDFVKSQSIPSFDQVFGHGRSKFGCILVRLEHCLIVEGHKESVQQTNRSVDTLLVSERNLSVNFLRKWAFGQLGFQNDAQLNQRRKNSLGLQSA